MIVEYIRSTIAEAAAIRPYVGPIDEQHDERTAVAT